MKKFLFLYAFFAACIPLFLGRCVNNNSIPKPQPINQDSLTTANPDNNDMLLLLRGKWQSEADSAYVVEFTDSTLRHFNNSQLTHETMLELDAQCENVACQPARDSTGWCFLEKGQSDIQCNLVMKCDKNNLKFAAVGAANGLLSFKKLK